MKKDLTLLALKDLVRLNTKVQKIVDTKNVDWQVKYDLIFSKNISTKIFQLFKEVNISFDYYDPDTTYEEDIKAFSSAFKEKIEDVEKILENLS